MKEYCIWIVSSPGHIHSRAFDEVALCLSYAFGELGYDVPIIRNFNDIRDVPIVLGGNMIPHLGSLKIPSNSIFYNLEQVQIDSGWISHDYIRLLSSHTVWDYSEANINELKKLGVTNVRLCKIGYMPQLTRIQSSKQDIDVLFYGSLNERRTKVLRQLREKEIEVVDLFGVYGRKRDEYISRSKIVLNIHFFESKVFEIVRISYLLANRRFVISELGSDRKFEKIFEDGVVFSTYDKIVDTCLDYLKGAEIRGKTAERGFSLMKSLNQVQFLREALKD